MTAAPTAFVLGGGGVLGAAEVGMLRALLEAGVQPDLVVGTSVGALNGAFLAAEPTVEATVRLAELWSSLAGSGGVFSGSVVARAATAVRSGTHLHGRGPLRALLTEHLQLAYALVTQGGAGTDLAAVGPQRTADITAVDGTTPVNNTGDATARTQNDLADSGTAVFTAGSNGTGMFVLDLDQGGELVLPVVYRNGGPMNAAADGGRSPRLELGPDGVPVEAHDVGGAFRAE